MEIFSPLFYQLSYLAENVPKEMHTKRIGTLITTRFRIKKPNFQRNWAEKSPFSRFKTKTITLDPRSENDSFLRGSEKVVVNCDVFRGYVLRPVCDLSLKYPWLTYYGIWEEADRRPASKCLRVPH